MERPRTTITPFTKASYFRNITFHSPEGADVFAFAADLRDHALD